MANKGVSHLIKQSLTKNICTLQSPAKKHFRVSKTKSPKPKKAQHSAARVKAHLFGLKMLFASKTSAFTPDCILSPHFSQCGAISSRISASLFGAMNFTLPHFLQTAIKGFGRIILLLKFKALWRVCHNAKAFKKATI